MPIILATIPDLGALPIPIEGYGYDADPVKQTRLSAVIGALNDQLGQMAAREGIAFYDANERILTALRERTRGMCIMVGAVCITPTQGTAPTNLGLDAYWHPGTVVSGLIANAHIQALNTHFGTSIPAFSDDELLQIAGIGR